MTRVPVRAPARPLTDVDTCVRKRGKNYQRKGLWYLQYFTKPILKTDLVIQRFEILELYMFKLNLKAKLDKLTGIKTATPFAMLHRTCVRHDGCHIDCHATHVCNYCHKHSSCFVRQRPVGVRVALHDLHVFHRIYMF